MAMPLGCIIKLGGSVITYKNSFESVNLLAIDAAAAVIQKTGSNCIVVHGAGSFGHFQAKEYGTVEGFGSSVERSREGFVKTRSSVTRLLHIIVERLVAAGLPAVGISLCGVWETENRELVVSPTSAIEQLLRAGFIPVLHGDCVLDRRLGCTILSGDTIIQRLAEVFQPSRVVFLTDTEGIFDRPPDVAGARLLQRVAVNEDGRLSVAIETSSLEHDVTGGVLCRLKHAAAIACKSKGSTRVLVTRLTSDDAVSACVDGKVSRGTLITFEPSTGTDTT